MTDSVTFNNGTKETLNRRIEALSRLVALQALGDNSELTGVQYAPEKTESPLLDADAKTLRQINLATVGSPDDKTYSTLPYTKMDLLAHIEHYRHAIEETLAPAKNGSDLQAKVEALQFERQEYNEQTARLNDVQSRLTANPSTATIADTLVKPLRDIAIESYNTADRTYKAIQDRIAFLSQEARAAQDKLEADAKFGYDYDATASLNAQMYGYTGPDALNWLNQQFGHQTLYNLRIVDRSNPNNVTVKSSGTDVRNHIRVENGKVVSDLGTVELDKKGNSVDHESTIDNNQKNAIAALLAGREDARAKEANATWAVADTAMKLGLLKIFAVLIGGPIGSALLGIVADAEKTTQPKAGDAGPLAKESFTIKITRQQAAEIAPKLLADPKVKEVIDQAKRDTDAGHPPTDPFINGLVQASALGSIAGATALAAALAARPHTIEIDREAIRRSNLMNSDPAKKAMIDIEGVLKDRASGRAASLKTETREYLDTHPDDAKIMAGAVRVDGSKPPAEALKYVLGAGS